MLFSFIFLANNDIVIIGNSVSFLAGDEEIGADSYWDKTCLQDSKTLANISCYYSKEEGQYKTIINDSGAVELSKWDETTLKISLPYIVSGNDNVSMKDTSTLSKSSATADIDFYFTEDGSFEYEVILKSKPLLNYIDIPITANNLVFYYQEPLNETSLMDRKEVFGGNATHLWNSNLDIIGERPENVVGSYAVYHSSKKNNEYTTGKVYHIYRPRIIDSKGVEIWGELNITDSAIRVTIPQEFLDNAEYPVRHATGLTLGYTDVGGSEYVWNSDDIIGTEDDSTEAGVGTDISLHARSTGDTRYFKGVLVEEATMTIVDGKVGGATALNESAHWYNSTFSEYPSVEASTTYIPCFIYDAHWVEIDFDSGGTLREDTSNDYDNPQDPGSMNTYSYSVSVYLNYIPAVTTNFTAPTDENEAVISDRNYTYINLSIDNATAPLDTVIINWNETNVTVIDDSLVLAMNFNNNTDDWSKNAYDTDVHGVNCSSDIEGRFESGCEFTSDYIDLGGYIHLKNNFTLMAWVKPFKTDNIKAIISKNRVFELDTQYSKLVCFVGDGSNWATQTTSSSNYVIGEWNQMACIYNGTTLTAYLNGELTPYNPNRAPPESSSTNVRIGGWSNGGYFTDGVYDEIRIWNRTLSIEEINASFNAELGRYYMNMTEMSNGTYTYYAFANDTEGNSNITETRTITFGEADEEGPESYNQTLSDMVRMNETIIVNIGIIRTLDDIMSYDDFIKSVYGSSMAVYDSFSFDDAITSISGSGRVLSDTMSISESIMSVSALQRTLSDFAKINESIKVSVSRTRKLSDGMNISDSILTGIGAEKRMSDIFEFSGGTEREYNAVRSLSDALDYGEGISSSYEAFRSLSDSFSFIEGIRNITVFGSEHYSSSISDDLLIVESIKMDLGTSVSLSDSFSLGDQLMRQQGLASLLSDEVGFIESLEKSAAFYKALSDMLSYSESINYTLTIGAKHYTNTTSDTMNMTDSIYSQSGKARTLSDTITWSGSIDRQINVSFSLSDVISASEGIYSRYSGIRDIYDTASFGEGVYYDYLGKFNNTATVSDTIGLLDSVVRNIQVSSNISLLITFTDSLYSSSGNATRINIVLISKTTNSLLFNWTLERSNATAAWLIENSTGTIIKESPNPLANTSNFTGLSRYRLYTIYVNGTDNAKNFTASLTARTNMESMIMEKWLFIGLIMMVFVLLYFYFWHDVMYFGIFAGIILLFMSIVLGATGDVSHLSCFQNNIRETVYGNLTVNDYHIICSEQPLGLDRNLLNILSLIMLIVGSFMIVDFAVNIRGRQYDRRGQMG